MKNKSDIKRRLKSKHDTEQQRLRRKNDPEYLKLYNELRKAYHERRKHDPKYKAKLKARRQRYELRRKTGLVKSRNPLV